MFSRDAKRIANRIQIRLRMPISKGYQQRVMKQQLTGIASRTGTATEMPDTSGMASLHRNRLTIRMVCRVSSQYDERLPLHLAIRVIIWSHMRAVIRMINGVVARMAYGAFMPIDTRLRKQAQIPVLVRMNIRVPIRSMKWV